MKQAIALVAVLLSTTALAQDRDETIKQIMEAQGLMETFEQQLELGRQQSREQGQATLDQLMSSLNPPPEFTERFENAVQSFISETEAPWGASEIVEVWARYYGPRFTDEELRQLLAFYRSPLAQKEVIASRQALVQYSNYFSEKGKKIYEKAVARFIANLKLITKECNCRQ